jgi:hypothetical protein
VKTAVAAAWYYEDDKDELIRFIAVLNSGITQYNKDRVVIILRDFMRQGTKGGAKIRSIQYLKAARAIKAFMSDEDLHKLYAVEPTPYPIPIQIVEPKHEESTPEVTRHARRSRTKKIENVMQVTIQ